MVLEKITESELKFMECWYTPSCLVESIFSDFDNLALFRADQFSTIRLYQVPLLSFESSIDWKATAKVNKLSKKDTFKLRKNVGDLYCFGGRGYGKSMVVHTLDICNTMLTAHGEDALFGSVDAAHIKGVLDKIKIALFDNPIMNVFKKRVVEVPQFKFELKNGFLLEGINFNLGTKSPGRQFFGKHAKRILIEEASLETDDVYNVRADAVSEVGAVIRSSGMTNFTKFSPAGKQFYSVENRNKVVNYPQFINPLWDEVKKQDRIQKYGGEGSINYRIYVNGEVIEDGVSVVDMKRVHDCSDHLDKELTHFEIRKEDFNKFKLLIKVERPKNSEGIWISGDIGRSGVTEIMVFSEVSNKYIPLYNITGYALTDKEQFEIFKYVAERLEAKNISIDIGDGYGLSILGRLEEVFPKQNLTPYQGNLKITVGFEKDENGNVLFKDGQPVPRQLPHSEWSVQHLTELLYDGRFILPVDYKFETQFSRVIETKSGNRTIYSCTAPEDHYWDSWKVFSIAQWQNEFLSSKVKNTKTFGKVGC